MSRADWIDQIDLAILELLTEDARRTVTDIASRVNLSLAPVKRRIDRLERTGVIRGFTVIVDPSKVQMGVDAFSEVRLNPCDIDSFLADLQGWPEVTEAASIAGDVDVLLRLRVTDVDHLHRVISRLRSNTLVRGLRTLVALKTWTPGNPATGAGGPGAIRPQH